ncbi:MAG: hypothetical protein QOG13_2599 [Sphingomonadales bacterium]|jgi:hypothetical protein|nr:hypothetical protein [Sphingomonadales bacterium]
MAAQELSSTRRRVLGAAVALPIVALAGLPAPAVIASRAAARQSSPCQARWNRRLARYRRLHARWKAEAETGAFRAANDEYNRARAALIARFGSWERALRSRTGKPLCAAAFARVSRAEDVYYDRSTAPLNRAAIQLVQTPAPDLLALLAKIEIIHEHRLDSDDDMRRTPIDVLREDVKRLGKE